MCGYLLQILRWSRVGHLKGGTEGAIAETGAKELRAERCCQRLCSRRMLEFVYINKQENHTLASINDTSSQQTRNKKIFSQHNKGINEKPTAKLGLTD